MKKHIGCWTSDTTAKWVNRQASYRKLGRGDYTIDYGYGGLISHIAYAVNEATARRICRNWTRLHLYPA